jgi:hypothetical protein
MLTEIVARGGAVFWEFNSAGGAPPPPPPGPKIFSEQHARGLGHIGETLAFLAASAPPPPAPSPGGAGSPQPLGYGDISEHFVNDYGARPYSAGGFQIAWRTYGDGPKVSSPAPKPAAPKVQKAKPVDKVAPPSDTDVLVMQIAQLRQDLEALSKQVTDQAAKIAALSVPQLVRTPKPTPLKLKRSTDE